MKKYNVYLLPSKTSTLLRIGHTVYELETGYCWDTEYTPKEQNAYKIGKAGKNTFKEAVQVYRTWQASLPWNQ